MSGERTIADAFLAGAAYAGWGEPGAHDAARKYALRFDLKETHDLDESDLSELRDLAGFIESVDSEVRDSADWLRDLTDRLDAALTQPDPSPESEATE
jgi:hypothetical protein